MIQSIAISVLVLLGLSLMIFSIARVSKDSQSWWIIRMKQMTSKLNQTSWWKLFVGFLLLIFTEIGVVIYIMAIWPDAIKGLYIFCTANTTFVVVTLWLDTMMSWMNKWVWLAIKLAVSIAIGFSWLYASAWLVYDIIAIIGGIAFLGLFPALHYKRAMALGAAMVVYDVVGVYLTGWIVKLAGGMTFMPPAVVIVPAALTASAPAVIMLGLGDIIVGGVMMATARLYRAEKQAFGCYALAIMAAYALAKITGHGVPATMFIIPLMLAGIFLTVKYRQDKAELAKLFD